MQSVVVHGCEVEVEWYLNGVVRGKCGRAGRPAARGTASAWRRGVRKGERGEVGELVEHAALDMPEALCATKYISANENVEIRRA